MAGPARLLVNIDVEDIDAATRFYTRAFGWRVGRSMGADFRELLGAGVPIYLLAKPRGTLPFSGASFARRYDRHWTPVHFDVVVPDIDDAVRRAVREGATLERPPQQEPYGWLALLADPFGHGFCLLQLTGRGYDELVP